MDRLKIVYLIGELGLGGSEHQLFVLLSSMNRHSADCHVIVFNPSQNFVFDAALEAKGVKVWRVPRDCVGVPRRMYFIYRLLRELRPDVVHSWTLHDNPYSGLVGRLANVPLRLGSIRGSISSPGMQSLPRLYRHLSLHSVSALVVNSDSIKGELVSKGYPAERIKAIPNCVNVLPRGCGDDGVPDLSHLGIDSTHRVVGLVGNLRPEKNHLMFVEMMSRILPRYPDVRGLIVGQAVPSFPDLPDEINAAIDRLGLKGKVSLAGFRKDIPEIMRRLEVLCLTSTAEGMPNVILEAMSASRPVVATRVGGTAEVVSDGDTGFLIESGDVVGLSEALAKLLAEPDLADRMGARGQEYVRRKFGCEQAAESLMQFYRVSLARTRAA